jgi:di/tricarboxylate transporter
MSTNALASLRSAMIGAGLVVDASFRPGIVWIKTHRAEMVSFVIIAILVIAASSSYNAPHEGGLPAIATPEVIEKAVGDHAPCPGTMHATPLQHRLVNGSMEFYYDCHAVELTNSSWFAGFVLLVSLVLMVRNYPADLVMLAATLVMFIGGVIPAEKGTLSSLIPLPRFCKEPSYPPRNAWFDCVFGSFVFVAAFYGFSSSTVMSVAAMFIVVKCLEENGSVDAASRVVLGKPKTLTGAVLRMTSIVAFVSAFVLTSPLVTMMIPVVQSWCNRIGLAPIQLMMPLSFSAIIGGCITIIGAPVNLLIVSLARDQDPASVRRNRCMALGLAPALFR